MTNYVALLRGVNVGGNNILPMKEFRDLLAALGCEDVETYIQSGNAVFKHVGKSAELSDSIAVAWKTLREEVRRTGALPVPMHLRSAATSTLGKLGWGVGYQHAHDHEGGLVDQEHLPDELLGRTWYAPGEAGWEPEVARHMARLDDFRARSGDKPNGRGAADGGTT